MPSRTFASSLAAAVLALGALTATSSAQAHSDVFFSIGVQVPGLYVQSGPIFYAQPRSYYTPAPVYYLQYYPRYYPQNYPRNYLGYAPHYYNQGHGAYGQHWQRRGPYGDLDRDGILNRHDRDRDGDGVRNRFDRQPNNPWRR